MIATAPPPLPERLRQAVVWIGIATLAALSVLAFIHLLADVAPVLGIRGGLSARFERLLPVGLLSLGALGLAVVVAWLAGTTRRRELTAIAIGIAVLVVIRVFLSAEFDSDPTGEPGTYREMARALLAGDWDFRGRPMAYPFALAGAFLLTADDQVGIESVNLILAVLAGGTVWALTRGLYGPRVAALALLGYALWPAAALMTVVSIPQIAFDLATVAAAWAAVATPPGWRGSALTGAILGLGQYLRPTAPVMLPAYILARLWPGGSRARLVGAIVAPVLAFLLVLVPVVLYNLERTGSLSISSSDYGGTVLYMGTYEPSGGRFSAEAQRELIAIAGPDVRDWDRVGMQIGLQRIREDPLGIAALGLRKQDTLWGTEDYGVQYAIGERFRGHAEERRATTPLLLSQAFYVLVLVTATAGSWLQRRRPDALVPIAVVLIWTVAAVHALLEVRDRHHAYVVPLLLPLSALALARLYEAVAGRVARWRAA